MTRNLLLILLYCLFATQAIAQEGFPVPAADANRLFYLQRTSNTNTIVYALNYKKGVLDKSNPVHVYWIRYAEQGQTAELSWIQRTFAYGVKVKKLSDSSYRVRLVSYAGYSMYLIKAIDGKYKLYAPINGRMMILNHIFVKITGGSTFSPDIEYFEVSGFDPATGKAVGERKKVLKSEIKDNGS